MHPTRLFITVAAVALASITSAPAQMADFRLGSPVPAAQAERSIVIGQDTRWVNVKRDETIRFDVAGQSFGWRFDGPAASFDMMRVAPAGLLNRPLMVYIATTGGQRGN